MPVEIREIIIKTEITVGNRTLQSKSTDKELASIRRQLLEELRAMVNREAGRKNIHNR